MGEFQKALQEYYLNNGNYPWEGTSNITCDDPWNSGLVTMLQPYIASMPKDPSDDVFFGGDDYKYCYLTVNSGSCNGVGQSGGTCIRYVFESLNQTKDATLCQGTLVYTGVRYYCFIPLE